MFVTFIIIILSELVKFVHYRDTRAAILDPCIQGILQLNLYQNWFTGVPECPLLTGNKELFEF